jgi:hypothetical protein
MSKKNMGLFDKTNLNDPAEIEKGIKQARIIIWVITGFMCISAVAEYYMYGEEPLIFAIYAPIILAFVSFGIFFYRNPFAFSIAALVLYALLIVLAASGDPENVTKGIGIKVVFIVILVKAIKASKDYKVAKAQKSESSLLDNDLL